MRTTALNKLLSCFLAAVMLFTAFAVSVHAQDENVGKYDVHLFKAREAEPNPLLQELIDAYDADCPET